MVLDNLMWPQRGAGKSIGIINTPPRKLSRIEALALAFPP
jgi:hypothetical protein